MASKCWFVLKQTHYPPPVIPKNGIGKVSSAICLGHLIPDIKQLDNVINRRGPLDIPPDMPILTTKQWDITREINKSSGVSIAGEAGAPIAVAAGLEIKMDAGLAFKQTVQNFWEFESLETFIIQPTREYVEDSVEEEEVEGYLKRLGLFRSSTVFMITGIIVARGAKVKSSGHRVRNIHGGLGAELPTIAHMGTGVDTATETEVLSTAQMLTDFIWAIRLAKITKGAIDRKWSHTTMSRGATFGLDDQTESGSHIMDVLKGEGIEGVDNVEKFTVQADDDVFVIGGDW